MRRPYKKVLLKLSGEVLAGKRGWGYSTQSLFAILDVLSELWREGIRIGIVVGGGNIWRGRMRDEIGVDRVVADQMGMLATVMNALVIVDLMEKRGVKAKVVASMDFGNFALSMSPTEARRLYEEGCMLVYAGGTSNPFFTTDTAAVLRAAEIGAEVVLKGTKVDGVYDKDPAVYPDAKRFSHITVEEIVDEHLGIIDLTAASMLREVGLQMVVFNIYEPYNLIRVVHGEDVGTLIT